MTNSYFLNSWLLTFEIASGHILYSNVHEICTCIIESVDSISGHSHICNTLQTSVPFTIQSCTIFAPPSLNITRVLFRIFVKGGGGGANATIPELRGGGAKTIE